MTDGAAMAVVSNVVRVNAIVLIDWLPAFDAHFLPLLHRLFGDTRLIVVTRDARECLLDWLALGSATGWRPTPEADAAAWLAFKKGGKDPRGIDINGRKGYTRVKDTGMYYPATGRLAASLWEMLTSKEGYGYHGNPYVFRVDARRLHDAWRAWAEGGLRYIREVCYPWYPKYLQPDGTIAAALNLDGPDPAADLAGYFGTGIFLAMGVWAGRVAPGSTSLVQKYTIYPQPAGFSGVELHTTYGAYGMENSSVSSSYSGAFLPIYDPAKWPDQCMGERYHRGPLGISIVGALYSGRTQFSTPARSTQLECRGKPGRMPRS